MFWSFIVMLFVSTTIIIIILSATDVFGSLRGTSVCMKYKTT
jgi:hypothetical protein